MGGIWRDLSEWRQDFWQAAIYHGAAGRIRRGRAPLTSLLLVISSLQVSIPAYGFPATRSLVPSSFLFSSRESRPHEHCYDEQDMITSSNA